MKNGMGKEKKAADYGQKKQVKSFGHITKVTSNNQCKRAGTMDARATQHK